MPVVIDDAFLPATLASHLMTDEEFAAFCAEHTDLSFEMTAEGEIIVMLPTAPLTGDRNSEIDCQLRAWQKRMDAAGHTIPPPASCSQTVPAAPPTHRGS